MGNRWIAYFFLEGYTAIFKKNIKEVVGRYYELTRGMIEQSNPSIIGHLDKIKIQNLDNKFFNEAESWYRQEVIKTLDTIEKAGTILEVNTRGIYQKKSSTPYPSPWILELAHQRGIPIVLNSDAHYPDDLTNHFAETARLLSAIGFKKLTILHDGLWNAYRFNENGIILD